MANEEREQMGETRLSFDEFLARRRRWAEWAGEMPEDIPAEVVFALYLPEETVITEDDIERAKELALQFGLDPGD